MIESLTESLTKFYGFDWLASIGILLGIFLIAEKRRIGFLVMAIGSLLWIAYAVITGSAAQIISNIILVIINLFGWWKWKKHTATK